MNPLGGVADYLSRDGCGSCHLTPSSFLRLRHHSRRRARRNGRAHCIRESSQGLCIASQDSEDRDLSGACPSKITDCLSTQQWPEILQMPRE